MWQLFHAAFLRHVKKDQFFSGEQKKKIKQKIIEIFEQQVFNNGCTTYKYSDTLRNLERKAFDPYSRIVLSSNDEDFRDNNRDKTDNSSGETRQ